MMADLPLLLQIALWVVPPIAGMWAMSKAHPDSSFAGFMLFMLGFTAAFVGIYWLGSP